jgi:hypothetical protein
VRQASALDLSHLATKSDLAELKLATKADIAELRLATKADLAALKADLQRWTINVVLTAGIFNADVVVSAMFGLAKLLGH